MIRFYEELQKFEKNMKTASESGYSRNITVRERKRLYEIHNTLTGKNRRFNAACPKCMIEVLTELAKRYFKFKGTGTSPVTDDEAPDVRQVFTDRVPDEVPDVEPDIDEAPEEPTVEPEPEQLTVEPVTKQPAVEPEPEKPKKPRKPRAKKENGTISDR